MNHFYYSIYDGYGHYIYFDIQICWWPNYNWEFCKSGLGSAAWRPTPSSYEQTHNVLVWGQTGEFWHLNDCKCIEVFLDKLSRAILDENETDWLFSNTRLRSTYYSSVTTQWRLGWMQPPRCMPSRYSRSSLFAFLGKTETGVTYRFNRLGWNQYSNLQTTTPRTSNSRTLDSDLSDPSDLCTSALETSDRLRT